MKTVKQLENNYQKLYEDALKLARTLIKKQGSLYRCALISGQKSISTYRRILLKEKGHNIDILIKVCRDLQDTK